MPRPLPDCLKKSFRMEEDDDGNGQFHHVHAVYSVITRLERAKTVVNGWFKRVTGANSCHDRVDSYVYYYLFDATASIANLQSLFHSLIIYILTD